MYHCLLFCILLFIPLNSGDNVTVSTKVNKSTTSPSSNSSQSNSLQTFNNTKIISEGGPLSEPIATLPKEEHIDLLKLDKEIVIHTAKPIVPRKGVVYTPLDDHGTSKLDSAKERIDTTIPKELNKNNTSISSVKPNNSGVLLEKKTSKNTSTVNDGTEAKEIKPTATRPHKPLVVSDVELSESGKRVANELKKLPKLETSSSPIVSNQLPSPSVKVVMNAHRHPGLVMPIVLTMLLVPMFAVLGYLALRRGQEAWKNRHYKRMDFLLDGMYND